MYRDEKCACTNLQSTIFRPSKKKKNLEFVEYKGEGSGRRVDDSDLSIRLVVANSRLAP